MLERIGSTSLQIALDVLPIALVILFFQAGILRRYPTHLRRILIGIGYTLLGLTLFRLGLEDTLLPLGESMARQLVSHGDTALESKTWLDYLWLLAFAGSIGLAATLIEPTLIAIAQREQDLTGGQMRAWDLRLVVSVGVALGLILGTGRILVGIPVLALAIPMILLTAILAFKAPKFIVPLALDTGPMATSVVTVPLIAAFGIAVARTLPDRDPVLDGFGLVFFALLTPVFSLLAFTSIRQWQFERTRKTGA